MQVSLQGGQEYDIRVEYYEGSGNAIVQLKWQPPNAGPSLTGPVIVPKGQLLPPTLPLPTTLNKANSPVWKGLANAGNGRKMSGIGRDRRYYDWDHTHRAIEVYDRNGNHLESMDPNTGQMTKPPVPRREISVP